MKEISAMGNCVSGALMEVYNQAKKNNETSYANINGLVFVVFPEEDIRFPNLENKWFEKCIDDDLRKTMLGE